MLDQLKKLRTGSAKEAGSQIGRRPIGKAGSEGVESLLERYSHEGIYLGVSVGVHL